MRRVEKKLEELIKEYNQDDENFIAIETLKIFMTSKDDKVKLDALELLGKIGRPNSH